MNLYIVRHAEAAAKEIDPERKLTEGGLRDAQALGKLMAGLQLGASEIWHSPKPRAAQTAHAIADAVGLGNACLVREGLLPDDPVKPLAKILNLIEQYLIIVGHDPFLTRLASRLVCGRASAAVVDLEKPSLLHLSNVPEGEWRIVQLLSPVKLKPVLAEIPNPPAANP